MIFLWPSPVRGGNYYAGVSPGNPPWPGGIVPYEFTNTLTAAQARTYLDGLREWELAANVIFVPHSTETNWILFSYNTNFLDFVGGGSHSPQIVTISRLSRAQVCHEMGHSFGLNHENIRSDAATYLAVLTNNLAGQPSSLAYFAVDPTTVPQGNYDFESVMHLGWDFSSIAPGVLATQEPKPPYFPRYQFRLGNFCLSPGDRAALASLYGPPAVPLTNVVTTTGDTGPGSLRSAIYYATDHPGATVRFNLPTSDPGFSNGVFTIHLTGMLPPLAAAGMIIDGSTQPGFAGKPLIVVDASQIIPETKTSDTFLVYSANNQIRSLAFTGFDWNGLTLVRLDATNNTISGCWFGLDHTGTNAAPNAFQGILIGSGASRNFIGGQTALERNVISGNGQYGVYITDSNTTANVVLGNYVGTSFAGSNAVPNGKSGVFIGNGAGGCIVGGTNAGARNVVSGNAEYGVYFTATTGNTMSGNYAGIDAAGSHALANGKSGVFLGGSANGNVIGGATAPARNILSGNAEYGVWLSGLGTTANVVLGNYIGVDAAGGNSTGNQQYGIGILAGASSNVIGGGAAGAGNVISGNTSYGLFISDSGTSSNRVQGNFIGPDATGTNAMGNGGFGVGLLGGASDNWIGGSAAGEGNVISGSPGFSYGVAMIGANSNFIRGNLIGTDPTGTNALANGFANVAFWGGSAGNSVGGGGAGEGNVIAFSGGYGVVAYDPSLDNSIRGNSIFGNNYLSVDLNGDGVTPNDSGDADAGPNGLQNYPVITNTFGYATRTVVLGTLNSQADQSFILDFYGNPDAAPSGHGPGRFHLGSVSVSTDGSGNATFAFTNFTANVTGQFITATATSAPGSTSEFAANVLATNAPMAFAQFIGPFELRADGFAFTVALETNFTYRIQTATNLAVPVDWTDLTNFSATTSPLSFIDRSATNVPVRFYRIKAGP